MKNYTLKLLLVLSVVMVSCKPPLDKLGPDLCPSPDFSFSGDDLKIEGLNALNEVDLSLGGLNIKAKFSEKVKWDLKIVSTDGLALKSYNGEGDSINFLWYGNVDALPVFKEGDVRVELEIACKDLIEKTFKISKAPTFKNLSPKYGVLIRDFDKNGIVPVGGDQFTPADGWAGLNGDTNHFKYFDEDPSPMAGKYGELYSKSSATTWYHGATSFPIPGFAGKLSTANSDSIYVNFFCKGYGLVNTGLEFGLTAGGTNYFYTDPLIWEGWKLVSIKLSDMKVLSGAQAGKKLTNADAISQCILQLGSNPEKTNEAKSAYDFIILTVGEPFVKSN